MAENLGKEMCALYRDVGIFGGRQPVLDVVERLAKMDLQRIHPMHGGSLVKDVIPKYMDALCTQPFWYSGKVFGRMIG